MEGLLLTEDEEDSLEWWDDEWDEMTGVVEEPCAGAGDDADDEDDDLVPPAAAVSLRFVSSFFLSSLSFFMLAFALKRCLKPFIILRVWGGRGRYGGPCTGAIELVGLRYTLYRCVCIYVGPDGSRGTDADCVSVGDGRSNDDGGGAGRQTAGDGFVACAVWCKSQSRCRRSCLCLWAPAAPPGFLLLLLPLLLLFQLAGANTVPVPTPVSASLPASLPALPETAQTKTPPALCSPATRSPATRSARQVAPSRRCPRPLLRRALS